MPSEKNIRPVAIEVAAGKIYNWCKCGASATLPFCDKTPICAQSLAFEAELNETLYFCVCQHTEMAPLCDGSHAKLILQKLPKKS